MRSVLHALLCTIAHAAEADRPRLVAIAPAEWVPVLAPWVEARKKDLDVEAVALEDVLATNEGRDAPERIKRFLFRGWKERNVRYALLVGDADTFPFRFMVLDRCTPAAFDTCQALVAPGGVIANVGVHGRPVTLKLEKLWAHNIALTTRLVDTVTTPMLLKLFLSGRLRPARLVTHRFALGDAMKAYETFGNASSERALKVVLKNH